VLCKIPAHDEFCPAEEGLDAIFEMAKKWGWQRCINCRNMVGMSYRMQLYVVHTISRHMFSLLTLIDAVATLNGATNVVRGGGLATVNEALHASSVLPTEKRN
jgi:hypothetical protein